jgi:biopolymer transport protein ExbD
VRTQNTRAGDSTFDLNLAPVLDIIVSIVPMLLLSVAFVQIKMIEAPTPQVVLEQKSQQPPKPETTITLRVSKKSGFEFAISDVSGKITTSNITLIAGGFDFQGLLNSAIKLKGFYPDVSKIQLAPEADVAFDDIVKVMDQIRQKPRVAQKLSISEAASAKPVENEYLFPDVTFSSIGG